MEAGMKCTRVVVVAVVAAVTLGACSSDKNSATTSSTKGKGRGVTGSLTVITNAGLENVVTRLVKAYTRNNPGAKVKIDTKATRTIKTSVKNHRSEIVVSSEP